MIVERIRAKSGAERANEADGKLPDKVDTEADANPLAKHGLSPGELAEDLEGQPPGVG